MKVRGKALAGGVQKDGIATFVVGDACFAKGENAIEVVALEDMSLLDFSVKVSFGASHLRGNVSESARYELLHPRFAKAFAFMRRPDLAKLPCGRYEIDGSNCWATISNALLKPFSVDNKYEVHRAFIDIQTPITGCETIGVTKPGPKVFEGFNVEGDYVLFNAKGEPWTLKPGEFAIFFPCGGAHAPGLSTDGPRTIRKLVVKVRNL